MRIVLFKNEFITLALGSLLLVAPQKDVNVRLRVYSRDSLNVKGIFQSDP